MYQANGSVMTAPKPRYHQKFIAPSSEVGLRTRITVWLTKNAPPVSSPPPISQTPHERRSALSSTIKPSQSSRIVLVSETAITAQ